MVDAYLLPGVMGAVTDGNKWIFKIDGQYLNIGPMLQPDGYIDEEVYGHVVRLISTVDEKSALALSDAWLDTWEVERKAIGPKLWRLSGGKRHASLLSEDTI